MKKIIIDTITKRIDHLEGLYSDRADSGDIKALQGIERCIELLMRLHGIDGKSVVDEFEDDIIGDNSMINLSDLSTDTLKELISLIECQGDKATVKQKNQRTKHPRLMPNVK